MHVNTEVLKLGSWRDLGGVVLYRKKENERPNVSSVTLKER